MGAIARAARAAGARTVGVIPTALRDLEVADDEADELVVVADMRIRKGEMDRRADAFLALPGGLGTLEELLEIWVTRSLGMHDKPVVILDPDGSYELLRQQVDVLVDRGFARSEARDMVQWATNVDQALTIIERTLSHRARELPSASSEELLEAEL